MPEKLDGNSTQAQIDAVATLMYHCGVALKTNYSPEGSGTYELVYLPALINYFGYDKSGQHSDLDYYTLAEWTDSLKADLDAGRPILYRGEDFKYGGHAFVMDGYNAEGYYHFNWGWSGHCDGFYSLLKLQFDGTKDDFTDYQEAWLHVMPDQGGQQRINMSFLSIYCATPTVKLDTCGGMVTVDCNCSHSNANKGSVKVYLTLENNADGGTQDLAKFEGEIEPCHQCYFDSDNKCDFNGVKNGTYKLYPTYETDNVSRRKVRSWNVLQGYLDVTVKDGIVTFGEDELTGIHKVPNTPNAAAKGDGSIFNLWGRKAGTDWEKLSPGIYLKDGEKIMKK